MEENPYKSRRIARRLTQQQVADACHISRLAVIRNEQGLFEKPLPAITTCSVFDFSGLEVKYTKWVRLARKAVPKKEIGQTMIMDSAVSPFELRLWQWFESRSRQKFSRELRVHPVSLVGYCDGRQPKMPDQIVQALKDIGYSVMEIDWLKSEMYEWGEYIRGAGVR